MVGKLEAVESFWWNFICKKEIWDSDIDTHRLNQINNAASSIIHEIKQDLLVSVEGVWWWCAQMCKQNLIVVAQELKRLIESIEDVELQAEMVEHFKNIESQFGTTIVTLRKAISSNQTVINQRTRNKLFEYSNQLRNRLEEAMVNGGQVSSDKVATKAAHLTGNLQSVSRLLADEVEKSKLNLDTLTTSSATVSETSQEFKLMSNYIANSKTLLSKYGRRELTDKILTILAFAFFFGCVIYVVSKRVYYR